MTTMSQLKKKKQQYEDPPFQLVTFSLSIYICYTVDWNVGILCLRYTELTRHLAGPG